MSELRRTACPCIVGLLQSLSLCAAGPAHAEDPAAWFQATTQKLFDAVALGDRSVWEEVLDESCTVTTEDGEVFGKRAYLEQLKPLPSGFEGHITVEHLTVQTLTGAAVVHYWLDETEDIFGQHLHTRYVDTDTYRRAGNSWRAVAMQVTVVPRDLEPIDTDQRLWPSLVGEYAYSERAASRYRVFQRQGALYGGRDVSSATRLIPLAPLVFFQQGSIHIMVFVRDRQGAISEVRELHKYNEVRMQRLAPKGS
jgi:hypothetical protein